MYVATYSLLFCMSNAQIVFTQVNVIVVIHPRKEADGMELGLSSIGGTAKASQEADLVMILQRFQSYPSRGSRSQIFLDVKKNRYDGALGRVALTFNPVNMLFEELPHVAPRTSSSSPTETDHSESTESNIIKTGVIDNKLRKGSAYFHSKKPYFFEKNK